MSDLLFYDAAKPPARPPQTDGVAFYIGGDATHIWSADEIESQPARYRLPIYVRSNPSESLAAPDVRAALAALHNIGAPRGCLVAWDTETAADPRYMTIVYTMLAAAGYKLLDYGSQDSLFGNELPVGGYYWGADWTGEAHINAGEIGTQYASDTELGVPWDLSIFKPGLPFWDARPQNPDNWTERIMQNLPIIRPGTNGNVVRTIQGLCVARDQIIVVDGKFGPQTEAAVRAIQRAAGFDPGNVDGIVGRWTWPVLMGL